jgi:peptidoglycan hydrolase-like protein with peptidoglycan-binding domain
MFSRIAFGISLCTLVLASSTALAAEPQVPLQVIVSKDQQSLVVYDGDTVIATSNVSTGKAGHSTPTGIFSILEKRRHHKSNIYSNAPMPYMQRLTWSGIALHSAKHVPDYPASHGCVRLPNDFAAELFKMTSRGLHVLISDKQVSPVKISNPKLFQPVSDAADPLLLSDAQLRPSMAQPGVGTGTVEVAMTDPAPVAATEAEPKPPIRILLTRRGERETFLDIQTLLNQLGHDAGVPDGYAGRQTYTAIKSFQTSEGLTADGIVTPALIEALYRKAGKGTPPNGQLMVRQSFKPLFEAPVVIAKPEMALGTHFLQFQDIDAKTNKGDWFGVTLENALSKTTKKRLGITADQDALAFNVLQQTLERITVPLEVQNRIGTLLAEGSSLTISDTGLGQETDQGTDFITVTHAPKS